MKRTALVLSLILIIAALLAPAAFADSGLQVLSTAPDDGATGRQPQNMAVKFRFSENMMDEAKITANKSYFEIKSADGTAINFDIVYNADKFPNELWLVLTDTLESNTEYTATAKAGVTAANGDKLAADYTIGFKTRNTKTDSTMSMILMVLMMGFMMFTTVRAARKAAADQMGGGKGQAPEDEKGINPYKLAKEKNISLEKANAIIEKDRAKLAKKQAKYEEEKAKYAADYDEQVKKFEAEIRAEMEAERRASNYRVKRAHSITEAGFAVPRSVVKANRKKREARAKAEKQQNLKKSNKKK